MIAPEAMGDMISPMWWTVVARASTKTRARDMAVSSTSRMAGRVGADQVEVLAGLQPVAPDQGFGRHGGGADDVGRAHGGLKIVGDGQAHASAVARLRLQTVKRRLGKALE